MTFCFFRLFGFPPVFLSFGPKNWCKNMFSLFIFLPWETQSCLLKTEKKYSFFPCTKNTDLLSREAQSYLLEIGKNDNERHNHASWTGKNISFFVKREVWICFHARHGSLSRNQIYLFSFSFHSMGGTYLVLVEARIYFYERHSLASSVKKKTCFLFGFLSGFSYVFLCEKKVCQNLSTWNLV